MAEHVQVSGHSHTHDMIINWLITNPEKTHRACAEHFGYTQAWVSTLMHTDLFKMKLKERQSAVFNLVMSDVPEKLAGLADLATVKLGEALEKSEKPDFILDAFDKILLRAGYAPASNKVPAGGAVINQNVFLVNKEDLAKARGSIGSGVVVENEYSPAPQILKTELIEGEAIE